MSIKSALIWAIILGMVVIFLMWLSVKPHSAGASNNNNVPGNECEQGEHTNNPHCSPSPSPTVTPSPTSTPEPSASPSPTPVPCEDDCVEPTPTPEPTQIPEPTPVPSGEPIVEHTDALSNAGAEVCSDPAVTGTLNNFHVYRNGDEAIVKWLPNLDEGDKVNIYYKQVNSPDWQYSVNREANDGYVEIHGLGLMDITFSSQLVKGCSAGPLTPAIVDGNTMDWVLFR